MRYLDPKADLTFKKVFGEHPDLVISLLNALLPFERGVPACGDGAGKPAAQKQHRGCALQGRPWPPVHCRDADGVVAGVQDAGAVQRLEGLRAPAGRGAGL